jgi:predicted ATPase/DNA-binding winged helix-turn-helix (wHTH) protein
VDPFLLGGNRVDPDLNRIMVGSVAHRLEGKVMAVLCELANHAGRVVESKDLLARVWRDTYVTKGVLGRAIHLLRKALDDDARRPHFIETIPCRGFRLVAAVAPEPHASSLPGTVTGHRHETPLVGREGEQGQLQRLLARAAEGETTIALLSGEPGVGKTRLAQALITEARRRGFVALRGHCSESQGAPLCSPWVDILATTARITPPAVLRELLGEDAPEVAKLLPELRRILPDLPAPLKLQPAEGRRYLFRCLQALLERSSRSRPLLLVLEDLHWADEATLLLLDHLAVHLEGAPVFLLGTYNDLESDPDSPLADLLVHHLRERVMHRVPVKRLARSGVASMLEVLGCAPAPDRLVEFFHQKTDGNPFFIEEVYRQLDLEGRLFGVDGRWITPFEMDGAIMPEGIRLVLERRLLPLSRAGRSILTSAALIGRRFSYELLCAVAPFPYDRILDTVERAQSLFLIEADPDARGLEFALRFRHELVRQTLLGSVSKPRRRRQHLVVTEAIEKRNANG